MTKIPLYSRTVSQDETTFIEIKPIKANNPFLKNPHPHRHLFYEMIYIRSGKGQHEIDFETYPIKPNHCFFIAPGQVHMLKGENLTGTYLAFTQDAVFKGSPSVWLNQFPFFNHLGNPPYLPELPESDLSGLIQHAQNQYRLERKNFWLIHAILMHILYYLEGVYKTVHSAQLLHPTNSLSQSFFSLVFQPIPYSRFVRDYAQKLSVSPQHLNAVVAADSGQSAKTWITQAYLLAAKRRLAHSQDPVQKLSNDLGFENSSQFSRFFTVNAGQTPTQFRASHLSF